MDFPLSINHFFLWLWIPLGHFLLMYLGSLARAQLRALTKTSVAFREAGHVFRRRKNCVYLNHFPKGKKAGDFLLFSVWKKPITFYLIFLLNGCSRFLLKHFPWKLQDWQISQEMESWNVMFSNFNAQSMGVSAPQLFPIFLFFFSFFQRCFSSHSCFLLILLLDSCLKLPFAPFCIQL